MTAPQFRDLSEFLAEAEPIRLPIGGKTYEFPGTISGRTGLLLTTALDAGVTAAQRDQDKPATRKSNVDPELVELLNDDQESNVRAEVFGGTDLEMARDGLDHRIIRHVFLTLVTWHTAGPEVALSAWESVGNDPAPANRKARRAAPRSGSSAGASKTRSRASSSGTSRRAAPAPVKRTASRTSSRTGT